MAKRAGYFDKLTLKKLEEQQEKVELVREYEQIATKLENEIQNVYCTIFDRYEEETNERV